MPHQDLHTDSVTMSQQIRTQKPRLAVVQQLNIHLEQIFASANSHTKFCSDTKANIYTVGIQETTLWLDR